MTDRRGLLRGLLAAGAALAALGAGRARPAHADFSGTGPAFGSTANYGLVASYGATSASQSLPALSTRHGVIGTDSNLSPSPPAGFDSGVLGLSNFDIGVQGLSNYKEGVRGRSGLYSTAGVFGENGSPGFENVLGGIGVFGENGSTNSAANGIGVFGRVDAATSVGVRGINTAGSPGAVAVQGLSQSGSGPGIGVHGKSGGIGVEGDSTNSVGVIGRATAPGNPHPGVIGSATNGYGVFGFSANSNGIAGQSGGGAAGCVGFAGAPGGYGIYGGIAVQGGYAGGFAGPVLVVGDFTATGGAKSAAVPHPDGTHRRLYCLESPESLFEDFGEGKLVGGKAEVKLDPDFAAVVHNDKYFVFLTEVGDSGGLYVSGLTSSGFEVREQKGGASSLDFDYRLVGRRKDIPAPRLEKVKLPEPIKELVKPELPKPPEPPKAPEPRTPSR